MRDPQRLTTLWASMAWYRDSFTFQGSYKQNPIDTMLEASGVTAVLDMKLGSTERLLPSSSLECSTVLLLLPYTSSVFAESPYAAVSIS
jgi:hypothetical protein